MRYAEAGRSLGQRLTRDCWELLRRSVHAGVVDVTHHLVPTEKANCTHRPEAERTRACVVGNGSVGSWWLNAHSGAGCVSLHRGRLAVIGLLCRLFCFRRAAKAICCWNGGDGHANRASSRHSAHSFFDIRLDVHDNELHVALSSDMFFDDPARVTESCSK